MSEQSPSRREEGPVDVDSVASLLANNEAWSEGRRAQDPAFFERLCALQAPEYLWIGCSDSRVPANQIVGLQPGEMFVHRNVANVVAPGDANCLSVLQFAIDVLQVRHVIVCGHYGCGGVDAVLADGKSPGGALGHWLDNVVRVHDAHREELEAIGNRIQRAQRLCELNVVEGSRRVAETTTVRDAWRRGQPLAIHAWVYDLQDGLLRPLAEPRTSDTSRS